MSPQNRKRRKKQPKKPMIALPKFVRRVKSHERYYYYYQEGRECKNKKEGQRIRIKAEPHEPQFWQEIARLTGEPPPQSARGTFAALIEEYKKSPEYKALKPKTASEYARYLVIVEDAWGGLHVRGLTSRHVLRIRDSFAKTPASKDEKGQLPARRALQRHWLVHSARIYRNQPLPERQKTQNR